MNQIATIDTAVLMAGGFGTRAWPGSLVNPKELALVNGIPMFERNLACFENVQRLVVVIGEDELAQGSGINFQEALIRRWIFGSPGLEKALIYNGKADLVDRARSVGRDMKIDFVVQPTGGPRGTAASLYVAKEALGGTGKFFVSTADDCLFNAKADFAGLQADMRRTDAPHGMLVGTAEHQEDGIYAGGIVVIDKHRMLVRILENQTAAEVNQLKLPFLAKNISKYILSDAIFAVLEEYMQLDLGHEFYLTDVLENAAAMGQQVVVREAKALYFDAGDPAKVTLASARAGLREGNLNPDDLQRVIDEFKAAQQ